jgi:gamma-glutamyltranspeptidase
VPPFTPQAGGLLSKDYAASRWSELAAGTQRPVEWGTPPDWNSTLGPGGDNDRHGTTHFVVVDKWKNVVSWTTTIEGNMGSSVVRTVHTTVVDSLPAY